MSDSVSKTAKNSAKNPRTKTATIAVVGMGAVGTTACLQLMKELLGRKPALAIQIHTFEKTSSIGAGLAYSTKHDFHLLNMRARTMSLHADLPADFSDWLLAAGVSPADDYVPRRRFGDYLRQRFAEMLQAVQGSQVRVIQHQGEVTDCLDHGDQVTLDCDGEQMAFDYVILCPGHLPERLPADRGVYQQSPRYLHSPWEEQPYDQIPSDARVGILGTSLTAVDVLLTLEGRGFRGTLACFSRKRSLPKVQGPHRRYQLRHITHEQLRRLTRDSTRQLTLADVQALFLRELAEVPDAGGLPTALREAGAAPVARSLAQDLADADRGRTLWYSALDATSGIIPHIWRHMDSGAKAHFLAEHESTWTMFRHCMPAPTARKLLALAQAERLHVHPGLQRVSYDDRRARFDLVFCHRGQQQLRQVDYLINATGTTSALDRIDSPLLVRMHQRGQLVANPWGGVEVDFSSAQLVYRQGNKSRRICLVGPLTKGVHFYTNSFEMNRDSAARATGFVVASLLPRETPRSHAVQ